MAAHHTLTADLLAYRGIVHSEIASGSMSPSNHELVAVAAQITSLGSLLGYAVHGTLLSILTAVGLTAAGAATIILSLRIRGQADAARINRVALWCAFGLIATYHRAHDGLVLVMILPYLLARLQKNARDLTPWSFVGLSVVMSFGPRWETSHRLALACRHLHALPSVTVGRRSDPAAASLRRGAVGGSRRGAGELQSTHDEPCRRSLT
jgi:hypothetical protein